MRSEWHWFVRCDFQIFSGCVCHLEQLHAQSPFLFPIVFSINTSIILNYQQHTEMPQIRALQLCWEILYILKIIIKYLVSSFLRSCSWHRGACVLRTRGRQDRLPDSHKNGQGQRFYHRFSSNISPACPSSSSFDQLLAGFALWFVSGYCGVSLLVSCGLVTFAVTVQRARGLGAPPTYRCISWLTSEEYSNTFFFNSYFRIFIAGSASTYSEKPRGRPFDEGVSNVSQNTSSWSPMITTPFTHLMPRRETCTRNY